MELQKTKVGGSSQKRGRQSVKCHAYRQRNTRLINKRRRLNKHLKNNPNDLDAKLSLKQSA